MSEARLYPPQFSNDDPIQAAVAMGAEYWRVVELARTDPERGEAEFRRLLTLIKREQADRGQ